MTLLIAGVLLWSFAHLLERIAPAARANLGAAGKAIVGVLVVVSVWMMYSGYGSADNSYYWTGSSALTGINNLLMLLAVYLFVISIIATKLRSVISHPQLTAVKTWAIAHLLVNGDIASFILFGGLLAWAVVSVILINKQARPVKMTIELSIGKEILALLVTLVVYGGIALAHTKLGYATFG